VEEQSVGTERLSGELDVTKFQLIDMGSGLKFDGYVYTTVI
jgi:hypothetical protein